MWPAVLLDLPHNLMDWMDVTLSGISGPDAVELIIVDRSAGMLVFKLKRDYMPAYLA